MQGDANRKKMRDGDDGGRDLLQRYRVAVFDALFLSGGNGVGSGNGRQRKGRSPGLLRRL